MLLSHVEVIYSIGIQLCFVPDSVWKVNLLVSLFYLEEILFSLNIIVGPRLCPSV